MSEDRDLTVRLVCGLLASAARLVPVPFLDDILRETALRLMVSRTLKAHGRTYRSKHVSALWGDSRGCLEGCLVFGLLFPIKLLIFPFRKIVMWIMAAKYVATDLSEAVLLGRALDQVLSAGRLPQDADENTLATDALLLRRAFESAIAGTDMRLLRSSLTRAVRSVSGLPRAALAALRRMRGADEDADPTAGLSSDQRKKVDEGADKVRSVLETPEIKDMLDAFDTRFTENLAVLEQRAS